MRHRLRRFSSHRRLPAGTVSFGAVLNNAILLISVLIDTAFIGAVLLTGIAAIADSASANEISKWVDRDGGVHYGDQPPAWVDATPVKVQPNVIDTGADEAPSIQSQLARSKRSAVSQQRARRQEKALPERAELRAYVEQCRRNRGVDCEWEARAMIDGPATVLFPGDPTIFARPDVKPPPPGLPLKFHIPPTPRGDPLRVRQKRGQAASSTHGHLRNR